MGLGRVVLRACRGAASHRWENARISPLIAPIANSCSPGTHSPILPQPVMNRGAPAAIGSSLGVRSFSRGAATGEIEEVEGESDDDPIMSMRFRTMDDERALGEVEFEKLWQSIEKQPTRALQIVHGWIGQSKGISKDDVLRICLKLCHIRRQIRALQIINWMVADKPFTLTNRDYGFQIRLTCRYQSPYQAELIYTRAPPEMKQDEELATALITALSRSDSMKKAEQWYKSLPTRNPSICNMMIILFLRRNRHSEALQFLHDLRSSNLHPNPLTYLLLLKHKDRLGGLDALEGIESEAEAALDRMDVRDPKTPDAVLSDMMQVYAYLGRSDKVDVIWSILRKEEWTLATRYSAAITSFGLLGKIGRAEKVLSDVLRTKKKAVQKPYLAMLAVYCSHGMMEKAERTMEELRVTLSFPWFAPYNHLVLGYLNKGENEKAYQKLVEGLSYVPARRRINPEYEVVVRMMEVFAGKKDVANAERVMGLFGENGDARLYRELGKVYVAAEVRPATKFLTMMGLNKVAVEEETRRVAEEEMSVEWGKVGFKEKKILNKARRFSSGHSRVYDYKKKRKPINRKFKSLFR